MPLKLPKGLTIAKITKAAEGRLTRLEDPGFCLACGAEHEGIEPDARRYTCESCGEAKVFGAEELVLMTAF